MPEALADKPDFDDPSVGWYLGAWMTLHSSRPVGMGASPIPLADIRAYAEMFPLLDDLATFVTIIQAMDAEFLEVAQRQSNG